MKFFFVKLALLLLFASNVFAVTVETMDEQVNSNNLTVLRLRIRNETGKNLYNTRVKYFVNGLPERPVVDVYDLGGANLTVDSLNEELWAVSIIVDTLPSGLFPYESGICIGIHNADWQTRDKKRDPSYIGSSSFVANDRVELKVNGNHLPNAEPLVLFSGMKILLNAGDSISFAWHDVMNAEKYRLSIYSSDSQLVYQKETFGNREKVVLDTGEYLWKVEAKNSATEYGTANVGSLINYLSVEDFSIGNINEHWSLGITSVSGHKDTPMLVVGWGEYADLREWDRPHLNNDFLDENESESCWAIAIKNLNKYYGGNLSLDEIRWFAKKKTLLSQDSINTFKFLDEAKGGTKEIMIGLKYALDSSTTYRSVSNSDKSLSYDAVKRHLEKKQIIIIGMTWNDTIGHVMLLDGFYTTSDGNYVQCVNIDNFGGKGIYLADTLFHKTNWYVIIDAPKTVRNMNPLLGVERINLYDSWIEWTDSDGDGITDFDEVYRFGTNPMSADSDSDGVTDKEEIHSYTILEKSRHNLTDSYTGDDFDAAKIRFIYGIESEYMADVDNDGLRAELDPDSDNDNLLDGKDSEPYKIDINPMEINSFPKDVTLYALNQLVVNDGTTCYDPEHNYCTYASEDSANDYGMYLGVRISVANLYVQNNVFIRNNPNITFTVNYYGPNKLISVRPDGGKTIDKHFDTKDWPWKLNISLSSYDEGDSVQVVHHGDTCFLSNNDHLKKLKVESGGVVYFPEGNVYVGDLQLDAGSLVKFSKPLYETNLHVKGAFTWRGRFFLYNHIGLKELARGFRLFYHGNDRIFFDTNWSGTIIAPNAKIVLGQTHKKNLYGQFFAREIVIHQYSKLTNVPFEPIQNKPEYAFFE